MFKEKFRLIFWISCAFQLITCRPATENSSTSKNAALTASPSINPDVEIISFDEDAYRKAAASNGMDPSIVAEVIRTRQPVIKTEYDENGTKRTTTYKLEADGSISKHTLTEYRPTTRRVHKTSVITNPATNVETPKLNKDWEWNSPTTHTYNFPTQYTPTWQTPTFTNQYPFGNGALPENWPTNLQPNTKTFEHVDPSNSGTVTKTITHDDGTKITTTHTVGPTKWTTHTYTYPGGSSFPNFNAFPTTTTTPPSFGIVPKINIETTTPFPSLQDFLKSQYGSTSKRPTTGLLGSTPVTTIDIGDLPTVRVPLNDFKPENRNVEQTQTTTYTRTIQSSGTPTAADLDPKMKEILEKAGISPTELLNAKNGTVTKTRREPDGRIVTTTYRVRTVPSTDGDENFGNPFNALDLAKPTFKSTFEVDQPRGPFFIVEPTTPPSVPHFVAGHIPTAQHPFVSAAAGPKVTDIFKTDWQRDFEAVPSAKPTPAKPKATTTTSTNAIEEFLAKVGLTPAALDASDGEVIKTIVDDKGRVLTATFVLSTVKNNNLSQDKAKQEPIK